MQKDSLRRWRDFTSEKYWQAGKKKSLLMPWLFKALPRWERILHVEPATICFYNPLLTNENQDDNEISLKCQINSKSTNRKHSEFSIFLVISKVNECRVWVWRKLEKNGIYLAYKSATYYPNNWLKSAQIIE